jgi:hypothetical protein
VTFSGQKQGWLVLMHALSWSRDRYWVGTDLCDAPVLVDRSTLTEYIGLIQSLLARETPRWLLQVRPYSLPKNARLYALRTLERAAREGWLGELEQALALKGNPVWEVAVHAVR